MEQIAIGSAGAVLVGYVAIVAAALLQIARAPLPRPLQVGWAAAVVAVPPFGALGWLLFGHPAAPFPVRVTVEASVPEPPAERH